MASRDTYSSRNYARRGATDELALDRCRWSRRSIFGNRIQIIPPYLGSFVCVDHSWSTEAIRSIGPYLQLHRQRKVEGKKRRKSIVARRWLVICEVPPRHLTVGPRYLRAVRTRQFRDRGSLQRDRRDCIWGQISAVDSGDIFFFYIAKVTSIIARVSILAYRSGRDNLETLDRWKVSNDCNSGWVRVTGNGEIFLFSICYFRNCTSFDTCVPKHRG